MFKGISSKRILLAEDNDIEALILERILAGEGHRVDRARDGAEALELCRRAAPAYDLMLTDVMMPRLSGIELIRAAKESGVLPPTIVLTGNQGDEAQIKSLRIGAIAHVAKPFDPLLVLTKIKLIFARTRAA